MTSNEEQQLMHGISGIAQSVGTLLVLFQELSLQRAKTDEEILNVLKLISRKH
jgi:hypothetical protein